MCYTGDGDNKNLKVFFMNENKIVLRYIDREFENKNRIIFELESQYSGCNNKSFLSQERKE